MAGVPEGWRVTVLGRVASERRKRYDPTRGGSRPYVGLEHIAPGRPTVVELGHSDETRSAKTVFKPGDVLFAKLRPYLRKVAMAQTTGVCSTDILVIYAIRSIAPNYLCALLSADSAIRFATARSGGTKMPRTSWSSMRELPVLLPPLPEQRKIAEILSSVDEAIQATEAVIEQTKKVKEGLRQDLLTKGIGHTRFKDTPIGRIPESWEVLRLDEIADIRRGASPRPIRSPKWFNDRGPGWVRIADVTRSRIYLRETEQRLSPLGVERSVQVRPGELLMSICAPIGVPIIVDMDACIHDGFVVFRDLRPDVDVHYLRHLIEARARAFEVTGQPGTQKNLNTRIVKGTLVAMPPVEEQRSIREVIGVCEVGIGKAEDTLAVLVTLKAGLLQDLLTGKVRVTPDTDPDQVIVRAKERTS